jgi:2-oxoglutarate ferredoxin oxidoreductase subunit beta
MNITILLFNNRIYGLTKGQYSPTSEVGKITKSTPAGSVDHPFNPVSLALGAEGTFVARTIDSDRAHLSGVLRAAAAHRGTSLVEIFQNCPIFNDDAFIDVKDARTRDDTVLPLTHGAPITFAGGTRGVVRDPDGTLSVVPVTDQTTPQLLVHDAHHRDPSTAFALSRLTDDPAGPIPIGVFRQVQRQTYDDAARAQVSFSAGAADLQQLLDGTDPWTVS